MRILACVTALALTFTMGAAAARAQTPQTERNKQVAADAT